MCIRDRVYTVITWHTLLFIHMYIPDKSIQQYHLKLACIQTNQNFLGTVHFAFECSFPKNNQKQTYIEYLTHLLLLTYFINKKKYITLYVTLLSVLTIHFIKLSD